MHTQSRALALVKTKVQQVLRSAVQTVAAGIAEVAGSAAAAAASAGPGSAAALGRTASGSLAAPQLPEGAEVSLLYVRFRAAAEPALKGARVWAGLREQMSCCGGGTVCVWGGGRGRGTKQAG